MTSIFSKPHIIVNSIYFIFSLISLFLITHIEFLGLITFNYLFTFLNGSQFTYFIAAIADMYILKTGTGQIELTLQNTWLLLIIYFILNQIITSLIFNLISYAIKGKPFKSLFN
jgi:hypothetical protein